MNFMHVVYSSVMHHEYKYPVGVHTCMHVCVCIIEPFLDAMVDGVDWLNILFNPYIKSVLRIACHLECQEIQVNVFVCVCVCVYVCQRE